MTKKQVEKKIGKKLPKGKVFSIKVRKGIYDIGNYLLCVYTYFGNYEYFFYNTKAEAIKDFMTLQELIK